MYSEIHIVFMVTNPKFTLQPMDQEAISNFKFYYIRNILHKAIAAIDGDSSDGSVQNKLKTFWNKFTILNAMKNTCDRGKRSLYQR